MKTIWLAQLIIGILPVCAQEMSDSATISIVPVKIKAYFVNQPLLSLTASGQVISARQIQNQNTMTLLPALNTVPGIRMEERSPGSYRIAMRGSLIRSPFGIRNVKIYIDDFPLTDAGGNTYLNLVDPAAIADIHIIKGPDGSLYGANSGGVIRIQPKGFDAQENRTELLLSTGSYGLFQEQLSVQRKVNENYVFSFDQSVTRSDGYRNNTALNKKTFQTAHQWRYNTSNELKLFVLYSDLGYRTPGGLTLAQYEEDPKQSRPAAGPNPSAAAQKAGIYNKTFYGGIAHNAIITDKLSHSVSLFGSITDFENPFITNYEFREEKNAGIRSYFSYTDEDNVNVKWEMQLGLEAQKGYYKIDNYDNASGIAADTQARDELENGQYSFFYRAMTQLFERWTIEGSVGLNKNHIAYRQRFPETTNPKGSIDLGNIWMPRMASSFLINRQLSLRTSISKGYSAPTIAEVRPSDITINTELEAETGTNYEVGLRWHTPNRRVIADMALYNYRMNNGIVRQVRDNGADYYVNAGEMNQKGIEAAVWAYLLVPKRGRFVNTLDINSSVAYNHYRFGDYQLNGDNYSSNKITAVPDWVWVNTVSLGISGNFSLNVQHQYTGSMPLDDGNSIFTKKFHLLQAKASWTTKFIKSSSVQIFLGVDNLLNEKYSLGNDINAFGGRYFNPAPTRNYYGGVKFGL
ncbi:TonB-dependent receptor [Sphingobacterium alkalisoli]|uniref:TonB-dependent receptor n=1 Tax=Sphingobacterium alkalisoli TaxID=1874115 RepID=A0A4U0H271_9SPHI|nr:TonB-dependent receptor [Sphingobacterium alkalisoli]TJY65556.1 TonB-dependent receptor [Sphingobacterium alkalisoli]